MKVKKEGATITFTRNELEVLSTLMEAIRVARLHISRHEPIDIEYIINEYEPGALDMFLHDMFEATS